MLSAFFQKLRLAVNQRRFDREIGGILDTPPVNLRSEPFIGLSMVHHPDVVPYLLAIKSFCRFLHPHRIIVVADPTITDADRSRISAHVCGVEFARAEDYREVGLPRGGCWERLIAISEFVQDDYVIQLDADTVALADMEEIRDAVQRRSSFVLATEDVQEFVSLAQAASGARPRADACWVRWSEEWRKGHELGTIVTSAGSGGWERLAEDPQRQRDTAQACS